MGDLNEVLHRSEEGVQERSYAQMAGFREMVDVCGLYDLGYEGRRWTFERRVAGGSYCRVRLDRALATADWSTLFSLAIVSHHTAAASDYGPILFRWKHASKGWQRARGAFKYELMWETHEDFSPDNDSFMVEGGEGRDAAGAAEQACSGNKWSSRMGETHLWPCPVRATKAEGGAGEDASGSNEKWAVTC